MKNILIIEDDPRIATALSIRLGTEGFQVWIAIDAVQGRSCAVQRRPDLIILDISLPGGDGLQLARQFQSLPETEQVPVIFVTASREPGLRSEAMGLGAAGLFEKPYDPEELMAVVQHALGETSRFRRNAAPARLPSLNQVPRVTGARKVLIIEDDQKIAMALALRMKAAHLEPHTAHDALSGLNAALRIEPDLVLLDISMPAGNGFTVAERLHALQPHPVPIIFLTASKQPGFRDRAQALGAAGYFEKPYEADDLMSAIQRALPG